MISRSNREIIVGLVLLPLLLASSTSLQLSQLAYSLSWSLIAGYLLVAPAICLWQNFMRVSRTNPTLIIAISGLLGLLVGARIDAGPQGLMMVAAWCNNVSSLGFQGYLSLLELTPWTHIGMLAGCNLAMLLTSSGNNLKVHGKRYYHVVLCNALMIAAMIALTLNVSLLNPTNLSAALWMLIQMAVIMVVSKSIADWFFGDPQLPRSSRMGY